MEVIIQNEKRRSNLDPRRISAIKRISGKLPTTENYEPLPAKRNQESIKIQPVNKMIHLSSTEPNPCIIEIPICLYKIHETNPHI